VKIMGSIAKSSIADLRGERARIWEEAQSLHRLALAEKRSLTAEEEEQWDRLNKRVDDLKARIDREERIMAIEQELNEPTSEPVAKRSQPFTEERETRGQLAYDEPLKLPESKEYNNAFRSYLRHGFGGMRPEQRAVLQPHFGAGEETRALGTTSAAVGGALVPQEFYRRLLDAMLAYGGMRQARTTKIETSSGATMPIPTVDDTGNVGAILAENTAVGELDMAFSAVNLGAYMYTSRLVRVSLQLLQDSAFPMDSWLPGKLGERLGRITNTHFTSGTGSGQPRGILAATGGSTLGAAGATGSSTTITFGKIVELEHSVDPAYRGNAQWMFHDTTLRALKQIQGPDSALIWLPGLAVQAPDTILGYPYVINQDVPQMAADAKSILFGDFSYYFIRDVMDLRILRLEERYADFLQVGFLAFMRSDGVFANPDGGSANSPIKHYTNSST
jgi:HK97 family phage major capsid protein